MATAKDREGTVDKSEKAAAGKPPTKASQPRRRPLPRTIYKNGA